MQLLFNSDAHFVIGADHIRQNKPCQDHALDFSTESQTICALSDGCSTGNRTDIGARVITCQTIQALKDEFDLCGARDNHHFNWYLKLLFGTAMRTMGLEMRDLLGTCLYATANAGDGALVHVLGDGVVAVKYLDGRVRIWELTWQSNTPYYPVYGLTASGKPALDAPGLRDFVVKHNSIGDGRQAMILHNYFVDESTKNTGQLFDLQEYKIPLGAAIQGFTLPLTLQDIGEIECIAIFSDGITDFRNEKGEPVNVMYEFMQFKNYNGDFVKRRMKAGLHTLSKEGIAPRDDFSMAAIHVQKTEQTDNE